MTDTDTHTDTVDLVEARARLRAAHAHVKSEEGRLSAVESGRDRAREAQWSIRSRMADAEAALQRAARDDPLRRAYDYVNHNHADPDADNPVSAARAEVSAASAEIERLEGIENALAEEAARIAGNLREHRSRVWQCMAEVICASDEFKYLCAQHSATFKRLRSIKTAIRLVGSALHGHAPQAVYDLPNLTEPLEERIGYPLDEELVGPWREALHALSGDAGAELPVNGNGVATSLNNNGPALSRPMRNGNGHPNAPLK